MMYSKSSGYTSLIWSFTHKLTWNFMNNVKSREVAEGSSGKDAVAVVQRVDIHHAQVQQL